MEAVKERPIIFSGDSVLGIIAGRKSQTRRFVKPQPSSIHHYLQKMWGTSPPPDPVEFGEKWLWREVGPDYPDDDSDDRRCPYGVPGDRLWVRETWSFDPDTESGPVISYRASGHAPQLGGWKSPIYMCRLDSRLTLEVTDVRVERLQDITNSDAMAEGIPQLHQEAVESGLCTPIRFLNGRDGPDCRDQWDNSTSVENFARVWEKINSKRAPWASNPWVWVVSFKLIELKGAS